MDPSATLGRAPKAAAASNGFVFSATVDALAHTSAAMEMTRLNLERVDKIGPPFPLRWAYLCVYTQPHLSEA